MTTQSQLQQVFADNFVAYFRSHVAHANTQGRNFYSDHKLLGKIYEDLQAQIDTIAELLRTLGEFMPASLDEILGSSQVITQACEGTADELLTEVRGDLAELRGCYEELMAISTAEGQDQIANYAQDRILALARFEWMLDSTLD